MIKDFTADKSTNKSLIDDQQSFIYFYGLFFSFHQVAVELNVNY